MSREDHVGGDFLALAEALDETREMLRIMVAGFVADGFTDREAHALVAQLMGHIGTEDPS